MSAVPLEAREAVRSHETGVIDSCYQMGAGNQTQVLGNTSQHSIIEPPLQPHPVNFNGTLKKI